MPHHRKTVVPALLGAALLLTACNGVGDAAQDTGENGTTIGIAMPTQSSERWINDGENMVAEFESRGFGTDLQYAEDVVEDQVAQIENMITRGADVLVVAAIDGEALGDALDMAASSDIPVVAYDRLIRGSEHVDYYATFDNFQVGVLQGQYIVDTLDLENEDGPFNIELFGGSPDDNNAYYFYDGAMSVLQPHIDDGTLVVRSGQTSMDQIATQRWSGAIAQDRMDNLLSANYSGEDVHAVLSPYDGISLGVIESLRAVGYGTEEKPLPVVTGQDAEAASVKSIIAGEQTQTVFKDTRALATQTVDMVEALLAGEEVPVNDTESYDNGVKVVPSYLLEPVSVDVDNYHEVLVGSGYYEESELE
ncbi:MULTISPECIES: multiple monosaccharide ABC transporter substrate-binding protein [Nocardiopsis]|uniref:Putative multiple sugar transport system substrate-binding protein n=1 Tax=Nocardiopsis sinuspersici TaxID=501010 RepID=A0A1V3BXV7_9ACTN|nr:MULTISPECIES: multiple monosaccharide ABC transporter substrate-binding protein [Nocardiopsis]NYH54221.1 putative multiple sugar transport system substrate-binding protein [Nocardiopsis sinuspersici]OOC53046.1 sugar ABC transporter substrate-binding protein [Nocardiopsis sinuspersici]